MASGGRRISGKPIRTRFPSRRRPHRLLLPLATQPIYLSATPVFAWFGCFCCHDQTGLSFVSVPWKMEGFWGILSSASEPLCFQEEGNGMEQEG
ncbi:hypothetical protein OPV22_028328 [Ensete ventricosum]|uniref:Uncharacterized protein n=1 Tax=Ensete ventricosum TaxID=4639 RepID=A0AAV8Q062_ENSVE|nr:hypothetical protein OPV22_028328 [Ensete ventricosum]